MTALTFGPVTSRRFGVSLGVDLSPHSKQCNFDCLYCELSPAKTVNEAISTPNPASVLEAIKKALKVHPETEYITLTANGEPTLYPHLEELVDGINALGLKQKLLILSNSSTITNPKISKILHKIQVVKLSLDTVDESIFKRLDRPHEGIKVKDIVKGIKNFAATFKSELILEILVVKGLNDTKEVFEALNEVISTIKPARVDVGTISRPPAYRVEGVENEKLQFLASQITNIPVAVPWDAVYKNQYDFSDEELLELLKKRPQSKEDVKRSFTIKSKKALEKLALSGKIKTQNVAGVVFYRATNS